MLIALSLIHVCGGSGSAIFLGLSDSSVGKSCAFASRQRWSSPSGNRGGAEIAALSPPSGTGTLVVMPM